MHTLKLKEPYFSFVKSGSKRIELRLYDEKRQNINIGDEIIFREYENPEKNIAVQVTGLIRYKSFNDLIEDFDIAMLANSKTSKHELLNDLNRFYTQDQQNQYGVVGIRFEKL